MLLAMSSGFLIQLLQSRSWATRSRRMIRRPHVDAQDLYGDLAEVVPELELRKVQDGELGRDDVRGDCVVQYEQARQDVVWRDRLDGRLCSCRLGAVDFPQHCADESGRVSSCEQRICGQDCLVGY